MLTDLLRLIRADRTALAVAVGLGLLVGCGLGWGLDRLGDVPASVAASVSATPTAVLPELPKDGGPKKATEPTAGGGDPEPTVVASATPSAADEHLRDEIAAALRRGVKEAEALGGTAEAAVMVDGWRSPVTAGSARHRMRMWSMSKPVAAVAVLQEAAADGTPPSKELLSAMTGAITRSENCRQRRVVLGLQSLAGGASQARSAFRRVLGTAGATRVMIPSGTAPPDPLCEEWLRTSKSWDEPGASALLLGTAEWTVADAARFAAALGRGDYGASGDRVLELMRRPKQASREISSPGDYTADLDWGAGKVFKGYKPAYKAGWGGINTGEFMAGQYTIVQAGGRKVAIAAMFHPKQQPSNDDPGKTPAPEAIEAIMNAVKPELGPRG